MILYNIAIKINNYILMLVTAQLESINLIVKLNTGKTLIIVLL